MEKVSRKVKKKQVDYKEEIDLENISRSDQEDVDHNEIERKRIKDNAKYDSDDDFDLREVEDKDEEEAVDKIKPGRKRKADKSAKIQHPSSKKEAKNNNLKKSKPPKELETKKVPKVKLLLDPEYNLEKRYFYQELTNTQWEEIKLFITNYFKDLNMLDGDFRSFFQNYENLRKGENNYKKLREIVDEIFQTYISTINTKLFNYYKHLNDYLINEYCTYKPTILECHFFPNPDNEVFVVNMLRTCKETLLIAIFTLTNDRIFAAVEEVFKRGVKVRIIADDECCKMMGSDVVRLAAIGVPCKTDSEVKFHMHHKFAILDNSVVVTGSFNWTVQAVKNNQENILFYENKTIANQYTEEFERLWNSFTAVITQEQAIKTLNEQAEKKRIQWDIRKIEKEKNTKIKAAKKINK